MRDLADPRPVVSADPIGRMLAASSGDLPDREGRNRTPPGTHRASKMRSKSFKSGPVFLRE